MYNRPAKRGWYEIDNQRVWCDSEMEAKIILRLVKRGFSGKWHKPRRGLAFGFSKYTPDAELSILHDSMNRRAIVEFKPRSAVEFPYVRRNAMIAAAKYYRDALCLLYVQQTKQWYIVEPKGALTKTSEPVPGGVPIDQLPRPKLAIPVWNAYGRQYYTRPMPLLLKKTADGLEFIVKAFVYPAKTRRRKR